MPSGRPRPAIDQLTVARAPAAQPRPRARLAEAGRLGGRPHRPPLLVDAPAHQPPRRRTRLGVLMQCHLRASFGRLQISQPAASEEARTEQDFSRSHLGAEITSANATIVPGERDMPYTVDFKTVSTVGLESSPFADALAGLRENEARYFKNKYDHDFTVEPASDAEATIEWVRRILKEERDIVISSRPLEATAFQVEHIRMAYVFYESGLSVNVMYSLDGADKRAVGFKLSDGMDVPVELESRFKVARQSRSWPGRSGARISSSRTSTDRGQVGPAEAGGRRAAAPRRRGASRATREPVPRSTAADRHLWAGLALWTRTRSDDGSAHCSNARAKCRRHARAAPERPRPAAPAGLINRPAVRRSPSCELPVRLGTAVRGWRRR
jgi:hypothetical protein